MILKLIAIAALVVIGWALSGSVAGTPAQQFAGTSTWELLIAFGAALIPAQFAYGGWQTACFVAGEVREPKKTLPRGLLLGVLGVIVVYLSVNYVCVHVLGPDVLARTKTPASAVMRMALGDKGGRLIAAGIAISTLGFLSQSMLTAPRVYFAMAEDKLFFKHLAWLNGARVPAMAIALQGGLAILIALMASRYEEILNYVVSVDVIFFALSAACVFVFRKRRRSDADVFRIPGHPFTTLFFMAACGVITFTVLYKFPVSFDLLALARDVPLPQRHYFVEFGSEMFHVEHLRPGWLGTLAEVRSLAGWLGAHREVQSILVVSSAYHLRRVRMCCRALLRREVEVRLAPVPTQPAARDPRRWEEEPTGAALKELLKLPVYWAILRRRQS